MKVKYMSGSRDDRDDNTRMTREADQLLRILTNPVLLSGVSPRRQSNNSTGDRINHLVSNMFRITGSVAVASSNTDKNKIINKRIQ